MTNNNMIFVANWKMHGNFNDISKVKTVLNLVKNKKYKKIKIQAFSKNWKMYATIGLINIAIPFTLIALGTSKINSYLAAILMSTTPMSGSILAHFFTKNERINTFKVIGVLIGFSGILFLFLDKIISNSFSNER